MFTGIIEEMGEVAAVAAIDGGRRLTVRALGMAKELSPGDSIAVDGTCLTAVTTDSQRFTVEAVGTTLSRTIAGHYELGSAVNLERALVLGGRMDGHMVQGHVDGVGELLEVAPAGDSWLLEFRIPQGVAAMTILHGSITVNGISLTINRLQDSGRCQVAIIPFTWEHTNLRKLAPGDPVNIEGDVIGKYVARLMGETGQGG